MTLRNLSRRQFILMNTVSYPEIMSGKHPSKSLLSHFHDANVVLLLYIKLDSLAALYYTSRLTAKSLKTLKMHFLFCHSAVNKVTFVVLTFENHIFKA